MIEPVTKISKKNFFKKLDTHTQERYIFPTESCFFCFFNQINLLKKQNKKLSFPDPTLS